MKSFAGQSCQSFCFVDLSITEMQPNRIMIILSGICA